MNDNELSTAVRESVADIHSATPVARIVSRGRAVRAGRRIPVVAGALTVAAGTALAVTTLVPGGHPGRPADHPGVATGNSGLRAGHRGGQTATVRLAAWTVSKQPNGDIDVTINQLKDPAGLQATLRADGLPTNVNYSGSSLFSASCQPYSESQGTLRAVARINSNELVIDPAALPSGTGVSIYDAAGTGLGATPSGTTPTRGVTQPVHPSPHSPMLNGLDGPLAVGLVYASQQCTG